VGTATVINFQEKQLGKQYQEFYGRKCSNFNGSYDVVSRPAKNEVTRESFTKDYIKLLTNFNHKGGDQ
jgi:hypothetical protein